MRAKTLLCLSLCLLALTAQAHEPQCRALSSAADSQGRLSYEVDRVWSGVRVGFSGTGNADAIWIAYYDAERWLTVAQLDFKHQRQCSVRLDVRFAGWDSHNKTAVALAPDGSLHLAANMHASSLIYARSADAQQLAALQFVAMTGQDEAAVTYPSFMRAKDGSLLFLYRAGHAGDGRWLMNRWDKGGWHRIETLFADNADHRTVSAYPSSFARDTAGNYHLAIVWRRNKDVRANYALSYARTADFHAWFKADGDTVAAPLRPDSADLIENSGENSGLLNNPRVIVTQQQVPIVTFTRYAGDGRNAIFLAHPQGNAWLIKAVAQARRRTELSGGGTIAAVPGFNTEDTGDGTLRVTALFPGEPSRVLSVDAQTLTVIAELPAAAPAIAAPMSADFAGLADPVRVSIPVHDDDDRLLGILQWAAQAPNRDQPRECNSQAPTACNPPPSVLRFIPARDSLVQQ